VRASARARNAKLKQAEAAAVRARERAAKVKAAEAKTNAVMRARRRSSGRPRPWLPPDAGEGRCEEVKCESGGQGPPKSSGLKEEG
jgi:phage baseplate assembly protein gpV